MKFSRTIGKRALSLLIAAMMCIGMMPMSAFAAEEASPDESSDVATVTEAPAPEPVTISVESAPETKAEGPAPDSNSDSNSDTEPAAESSDEEKAEDDSKKDEAPAGEPLKDESSDKQDSEKEQLKDEDSNEEKATADDANAEKPAEDPADVANTPEDDPNAEEPAEDAASTETPGEEDPSAVPPTEDAPAAVTPDEQPPVVDETPSADPVTPSDPADDALYGGSHDDDDEDDEDDEDDKPATPAPEGQKPSAEPAPVTGSNDSEEQPEQPSEPTGEADEVDEAPKADEAGEKPSENTAMSTFAASPKMMAKVKIGGESTVEAEQTPADAAVAEQPAEQTTVLSTAASAVNAMANVMTKTIDNVIRTWGELVEFFKGNLGTEKKLGADITRTENDVDLVVEKKEAEGKTVEFKLDLNGFTINLGKDLTKDKANPITIHGALTIFDDSAAKTGTITGSKNGGVVVANGGKFFMNGGSITGNIKKGNGAGVEVQTGGIFEMTDGEISNNEAYDHIDKVSDKDVYRYGEMEADGKYKFDDPTITRGGGVYIAKQASFTMSGGTIRGNHAGEGAGIFSDAPSAAYASTFTMKGGNVESNIAYAGEGGGIYIRGNAEIKADPDKQIHIRQNETHTTNDLGGGGIYIENWGQLMMDNVVITNNTAYGRGGGLAACVHGNTSVVSTKESGAAIYDNIANNTSVTTNNNRVDGSQLWANQTDKEKQDRADKITGASNDIFTASDSKEINSTHGTSGIYFSDTMLGGGSAGWTGYGLDHNAPNPLPYKVDASGHNDQYDENLGFVTIDKNRDDGVYNDRLLGMHSTATQEDKDNAYANGNANGMVYIEGNISHMNGGGIANNGLLIIGAAPDNQEAIHSAELTFDISKKLVNANPDKGGTYAPELQEGDYSFSVTQDNKSVLHAYDQDGNKLEGASVSIDASGKAHISFSKDFFSSQFNGDRTEVKNVTLVLKEDQGNKENVIYDKSEYTISFTIHKDVSSPKLANKTIKTTNYSVSNTIAKLTADENGNAANTVIYTQEGFDQDKTSDGVIIGNPTIDEDGNETTDPVLNFTNKYDTSRDFVLEKVTNEATFEGEDGHYLQFKDGRWSITDKAGYTPNHEAWKNEWKGTVDGKNVIVTIRDGKAYVDDELFSGTLTDSVSKADIKVEQTNDKTVLHVNKVAGQNDENGHGVEFEIYYEVKNDDGTTSKKYIVVTPTNDGSYAVQGVEGTSLLKDGKLDLKLMSDVTYYITEKFANGYDVNTKTYVLLSDKDFAEWSNAEIGSALKMKWDPSLVIQMLIDNQQSANTTTSADPSKSNVLRYEFNNDRIDPQKYDFNLTKVDAADESITLKDAKFKLYYIDKVNGQDIKMYCKMVTNEDGTVSYEFTTDADSATFVTSENGKFEVKDLLQDIVYYLQENEAPAGYEKDPVVYLITGDNKPVDGSLTPEQQAVLDAKKELETSEAANSANPDISDESYNDLKKETDKLSKDFYDYANELLNDSTDKYSEAKIKDSEGKETEVTAENLSDYLKNEIEEAAKAVAKDYETEKGTLDGLLKDKTELDNRKDAKQVVVVPDGEDENGIPKYKAELLNVIVDGDRNVTVENPNDDAMSYNDLLGENGIQSIIDAVALLRDGNPEAEDEDEKKSQETLIAELEGLDVSSPRYQTLSGIIDGRYKKYQELQYKYNAYTDALNQVKGAQITALDETLKNETTGLEAIRDKVQNIADKTKAFESANKADLSSYTCEQLRGITAEELKKLAGDTFDKLTQEEQKSLKTLLIQKKQLDTLNAYYKKYSENLGLIKQYEESETLKGLVGALNDARNKLSASEFDWLKTHDAIFKNSHLVPTTATATVAAKADVSGNYKPISGEPASLGTVEKGPEPDEPTEPDDPGPGPGPDPDPTPTPTPDPEPTPDPTPDPEPTPETPTEDVPDEPTPLNDLPDEETPLADLPDEDVPLAEEIPEELVELPEDPVPLADVPATGDASMVWLYLALLFSGCALIGLRKKEEAEG